MRWFTAAVAVSAAITCTPRVSQAQAGERSVIVAVPADTEFYVGKDRIARERVANEVDSRLAALARDDQVVFIKAAQGIRYGTLVHLIDDIRASGHDRIGLIADKEKADGRGRRKVPEATSSPRAGLSGDPEASRAPEPDAVVVSIHHGRAGYVIAVDGVRIARDQVESEVWKQVQARHLRAVMILAPANLPYSAVIDLIDAAKASGVDMIGLQIDELARTPSKTP